MKENEGAYKDRKKVESEKYSQCIPLGHIQRQNVAQKTVLWGNVHEDDNWVHEERPETLAAKAACQYLN